MAAYLLPTPQLACRCWLSFITFVLFISFTLLQRLPMEINSQKTGKLSGIRILLVEDDFASRTLLEKVLVYHGAAVASFDSGEGAVAYVLEGNRVDVAVLDIRLPRMDGYAVFNKLKEVLPAITVFAQTAYVYSNEAETVVALGFDGYYSKPIDFNKLIDEIVSIKNRIATPDRE